MNDNMYTLVVVTPKGKALNYYFKSKDLAVEYVQMERKLSSYGASWRGL